MYSQPLDEVFNIGISSGATKILIPNGGGHDVVNVEYDPSGLRVAKVEIDMQDSFIGNLAIQQNNDRLIVSDVCLGISADLRSESMRGLFDSIVSARASDGNFAVISIQKLCQVMAGLPDGGVLSGANIPPSAFIMNRGAPFNQSQSLL